MKVRAIIQARMSSSRLRGKTLMPLAGKTLLLRVVETTMKHSFVDEIIVATSNSSGDDPIKAYCDYINIGCIRGSRLNVFNRFELGIKDMNEEDLIIRITADNPFSNINASLYLFNEHIKGNLDYSYVDGLSHIVCEIIKVKALRYVSSHPEILNDYDKEHVTPIFRSGLLDIKTQMVSPELLGLKPSFDKFLTIDTKDDLLRIEKMISELSIDNNTIDFNTIYSWLEKHSY